MTVAIVKFILFLSFEYLKVKLISLDKGLA